MKKYFEPLGRWTKPHLFNSIYVLYYIPIFSKWPDIISLGTRTRDTPYHSFPFPMTHEERQNHIAFPKPHFSNVLYHTPCSQASVCQNTGSNTSYLQTKTNDGRRMGESNNKNKNDKGVIPRVDADFFYGYQKSLCMTLLPL